MPDVTQILSRLQHGDQAAAEELLPVVYDELRRLAAREFSRERAGHTLQATALVHEAYVRLVDAESQQRWDSRAHFFGAAAEAMRRILVESARRRNTLKRGGDAQRLDVEEIDLPAPEVSDDLLAVDEALDRLAAADPQAAQLVKLRYFSGLTLPQAAEVLDLSPRSADRLWAYAKAWLRREMTG
jgi:RNA polymerase sigma factor (TIGR02999 family)